MKLRMKAALIIGVTFLIIFVAVGVILNILMMDQLEEHEDDMVTGYAERAQMSLSAAIDNLDTTLLEWANWDDPYYFMEDRNQEFIDEYLIYDSFYSSGVNMFAMATLSGEMARESYYDFEAGEEAPVPPDLEGRLVPGDPRLSLNSGDPAVQGILSTSEGTMLVASNPILTTTGEGPIAGVMMMGRLLTEEELGGLREMTGLDLYFHPVGSPEVPEEVADQLLAGDDVVVYPVDNDVVAGYAMVDDVYGEPALVLEIREARTVYDQGKTFQAYMIISLIIVALLFALALILLLELSVIRPAERLDASLQEIGEESDLSARVEVKGNDELASLARSINTMLTKLEDSQYEITRNEHDHEDLVRQLDEATAKVMQGDLEVKLDITEGERFEGLKRSVQEMIDGLNRMMNKSTGLEE